MKFCLAICVVASMTCGLEAFYIGNERPAEFLQCAIAKWSNMFDNITYLNGSISCLNMNNETSVHADGADNARATARAIIDNINKMITEHRGFYDSAPETVEKYDRLFQCARQVLEANKKIKSEVANLDANVQECVDIELSKANTRINNALACYH